MAESFDTLQSIFRMLGPVDLAGTVRFGRDREVDRGLAARLLELMLATDARGVLSGAALREKLSELAKNASSEAAAQLHSLVRFYSTAGVVDGAPREQRLARVNGKDVETSMAQVVGSGVPIPPGRDVTFVLSDSPRIHPSVRDAGKVELFLNSIPTLELSRCVPYLDVEFQFDRPAGPQLRAPGLHRFLLGAAKVDELPGPDRAMIEARRLTKPDGTGEYDFAGMELFTSPQTLLNMAPVAEGTDGMRYAPVLDPTRPLASIEGFEVTVRPTVGVFTYKSARLTLRLHDRSRLAELSDLVRADAFSRTTVWITYGWRHPVEPDNPYAVFINTTMLAREAYGVVNSSFKFEQTGQVSLSLELFTRGMSELKTVKTSESPDGPAVVLREIEQLAADVARYRKLLHLDASEGVNKEIRPFQVLDAAERGEFPDLKASEVRDAVTRLRKSLTGKDARLDQGAADDLKAALDRLYSADRAGKFDFKTRLENTTAAAIRRKFDEVTSGADPFLPTAAKSPGHPLAPMVDAYNTEPRSSGIAGVQKKLVSFAKLFAAFAVQPMLSLQVVDEVQVFFYALNDQAGTAAGTNVGEFPIDLPVFLDQYREHVTARGSESVTVEEFLGLVVNSQVDDPRAVAYGLRRFFEPYDPKNRDPVVSRKMQGDYESALAAQSARMGPFRKPALELYVETVAEAASREGEPDAFAAMGLAVSARDDGTLADPRAGASRRIMRMHVYDKQLNPHRAPALLLRGEDDGTFIEVASGEAGRKLSEPGSASSLQALREHMSALGPGADVSSDPRTGAVRVTRVGSNAQIKAAVSRLVPTITYGSNASAVISAELASKQDPLLSTVHMQRAGKQNATAPNGAGVAGLPLRIIPASLTMPTHGCPLVQLGQIFFVDFSTGTTADNLYILTGLTHTVAQGKFESSWQLTFYDAYGKYAGAPNVLDYFRQPKPAA